MDCERTVNGRWIPPQHGLCFLPEPDGYGSFRPVLGLAESGTPFLSSSCFPPPIQRPAIPLAVR
jgi:hypothetical protein